ncbi:MAG: hypothetical protein WCT04_09165 [Planctomycetota bacterium]
MRFGDQRGYTRAIGLCGALVIIGGCAFFILNGIKPSRPTTDVDATPAIVPPPKPKDHFPLDVSAAFNEFIGAKWKRENKDGDGIPADGRVQVPAVVPRAYFNFILPGDDPNAILISGGPVTVLVPPALRGTYGRLAVMHGSQKGNVSVKATLVYTTGEAVVEDLRVQDWNKTGEAKETFVHKALKAGPVQLFSQNLKLDPTRQLNAMTFQSSESAVIFSVTLIVSGDRPFKDGE